MNNGDIKYKDRYLMLIPIITLVIIIIGGTYAFMESVYFKDSIVGTLDCYTVNYTKGQDVEGELNLGADYTSGKSTDIVMYSDPDCAQLTGRLYITTNNISTMDFSDNALRYTVVVDGNIVSEGAVDGTANQVIYENFTLNTTATTYKVYVWLSSELEDTSNKDDETYSGFIHAEAVAKSDVVIPQPNKPNLADNSLIPIYYDETCNSNQGCWKKADENNINESWYNYDQKKWANAVLVKENSYEKAVEEDKIVNIANELVSIPAYISDHQGVAYSVSSSIFTFTTGDSGGTFSFDYSVLSESRAGYLELELNGMNIGRFFPGLGSDSDTFTTTVDANTEYTLEVSHYNSYEYSEDDRAIITNMILPDNLAVPLAVTASGDYGWISGFVDSYLLKTYSYYTLEDDGMYNLFEYSNVSSSNAIGKYICSDTVSTECSEIYQIKGVNGDNIVSVDRYSTTYKEGTRTTYQEAEVGTEITESDILAYYVWIPRYKYKVWNIDKIADSTQYSYDSYTKGIDIVFENGDESTGTITCNYSFAAPSSVAGEPNEECTDVANGDGYYTHPAFKFGNDKLSGFWMGKFELSSMHHIIDFYGGGETVELPPRILPDVISWRYNSVDNFWKVIYNMQNENNIYGLPTDRTTVNSHMLTNMEWGAVSYLTHSKYGRCTYGENSTCIEVAINNSGNVDREANYTGRSSGVGGSVGYTETGTYTYKETEGQLASTTGNIYGIYDMSGGAHEYVMGNIGTSAGQTAGEYNYYASYAGGNYVYTGFEKYLTTYAYGTTYNDQMAYNRGRLGDATSEVLLTIGDSWYGDSNGFPLDDEAWFIRGGNYYNNTRAGIFSFSMTIGGGIVATGSRAALSCVAS